MNRVKAYNVIDMPVDSHGNGPVSIQEAYRVIYEVWDPFCNTMGSSVKLSEMISLAEELNEKFWNDEDPDFKVTNFRSDRYEYRILKLSQTLRYIANGYRHELRPEDFTNSIETLIKYGEPNGAQE